MRTKLLFYIMFYSSGLIRLSYEIISMYMNYFNRLGTIYFVFVNILNGLMDVFKIVYFELLK